LALLRGYIKSASTEKPLRQRIGFQSHPLEALGAFVSTASDSLANFKMQINPTSTLRISRGQTWYVLTLSQPNKRVREQVRTQLHVVRS
jgi:hypothetical protein